MTTELVVKGIPGPGPKTFTMMVDRKDFELGELYSYGTAGFKVNSMGKKIQCQHVNVIEIGVPVSPGCNGVYVDTVIGNISQEECYAIGKVMVANGLKWSDHAFQCPRYVLGTTAPKYIMCGDTTVDKNVTGYEVYIKFFQHVK